MNVFQKLNRKQKRQFAKMTDQQKEEMLSAELQPALQRAVNKASAEAFVAGFLYANEFLYGKYLTDYVYMDEQQREDVCVALVDEIVKGKKRYDEHKAKEKEGKNNADHT